MARNLRGRVSDPFSAALSGSQPNAPGFAGGVLTVSGQGRDAGRDECLGRLLRSGQPLARSGAGADPVKRSEITAACQHRHLLGPADPRTGRARRNARLRETASATPRSHREPSPALAGLLSRRYRALSLPDRADKPFRRCRGPAVSPSLIDPCRPLGAPRSSACVSDELRNPGS